MRVIPVVLALAAATLPLGAPGQPVGGGGLAILRPCAASQLRATVLGSEAAMLHRELRIALTNVSQRACAISGYPAVRVLDEDGHVAIVAERFQAAPPPHQFIVSPGQQAVFSLRVASSDGTVEYRMGTALAIIPPGDVAAIRLPQAVPMATSIEVSALLRPNEAP